MTGLLFVLTFSAALACGLMAGVFFAFSTFVMTALARLPRAEGISAMQSINVRAPRSLFGALFLLATAICGVLAAIAIWRWRQPGAALVLSGSLLYVAGAFLVTVLFNVPRNDALAAADPGSAAADVLWSRYLRIWTAWNHVRTLASLAAAAAFTLALRS